MQTPAARGSLSEGLLAALRSGDTAGVANLAEPDHAEDSQIALWPLFELHHRGFEDVDDELEWDPRLLTVRRRLEQDLERELRSRAPEFPEPGSFAEDFFAFIAGHDGPSLALHLERSATGEQMRQFLRHKSIYMLKDSDHTTRTIPRLSYPVKAAVVELQYDEYGAYIDDAPPEVLEQNHVMSMFGLNRRLLGASLGFLAAFEATSSAPSRRVARGLERLDFPGEMVEYYTEHVEADAVHEQLAVRSICGALLEEEPEQYENIYFGAWTALHMDDRYAERMLKEWAV